MEKAIIHEKPPRISIRGTSLSGWFSAIFVVFSFFEFRSPLPLNPYLLILFCLLGLVLALPQSLQALKLKHKKESKVVNIGSGILSALLVITFLELKARGIFIWHEVYLTLLIAIFSLVTFVLHFIAEERHNVKVYWASDGMYYVKP